MAVAQIEKAKANDQEISLPKAVEMFEHDINIIQHLLYVIRHDETIKKAIVKKLLERKPKG